MAKKRSRPQDKVRESKIELPPLVEGHPSLYPFLPSVIRHIPSMIFIKKADDLTFVLLNRAGEELLGVTEAGILGKSDYDFFPKDQADFFTAKDREVLLKGGLTDIEEEPISTPNGIRWLHTKKIPLLGRDGTPLFLVGISEDITEKKRIETSLQLIQNELEERVVSRTRELEEEKSRLQGTLRSMREGVIVTDGSKKIILVNGLVEEITGWSEEESVGALLDQILRVSHPTELIDPFLVRPIADLGELSREEVSLLRKDGQICPVQLSLSVIEGEGSGPNGLVVVFRDISAEREIELELLKAQKLESVGELAGGIAHDFNNLLAAILGNVSLALLCATDSGSGELRELLKTTEEACLRAKGLTDQLLTFSKGGAPIKKPVNVFDLLEESIRLSLGGSSLHCEVEGDPSSSIAEGDPGQLVQVFNNLFINAKQAMPAGGAISVSCRRTSQGPLGPERDCIEIQVIDSGIGIPAHLLDRVCDPYFTTKSKGSGLGLATAYSIIKQHGGKLQIRSIEGKGTSISIYLLASDQIVGESSVSAHRPKFHQGSGRILLMDDDPLVREVASRMLKVLGYEIEIALDGREAISKYVSSLEAGTRFKAAILDLTVKGGLGGRETAKQLLDVDPTATLIVSSGYSSSAVASRFEQFGFSGVLAKPYNLDALAQILSQVLRLEASQDKDDLFRRIV